MKYTCVNNHMVLTNCESTEDPVVVLPKEINGLPLLEIGPEAFKGNTIVKTVVIPTNLQIIGEGAFQNCTNLSCIGVAESDAHSVFSQSLIQIGAKAFYNTGLCDITFPSFQLEIGESAFAYSKVRTVWFYETDTIALGANVFSHSDLERIIMRKASFDLLPNHAFAYCKQLKFVEANSIRGVGAGCFLECESLESISIQQPLNFVGEEAFAGCTLLDKRGFFRSLYDAISAYGDRNLVEAVLQSRESFPDIVPLRVIDNHKQKVKETAEEVLQEIRAVVRNNQSQYVLISAIGSNYYGTDDWDYCDRLFLFSKAEIIRRFRRIASWDITKEWFIPEVRMPIKTISSLTDEETVNMVIYENAPTPIQLPDNALEIILNADLAEKVIFYDQVAVELISRLMDWKLGQRSGILDFEETNNQLYELYFSDEEYRTTEDRIHCLKWAVLFNRIALYEELKKVYCWLNIHNQPS